MSRTMRREGLEPSRPRGHGLLRPACLPVPPSARWSCSSLRAMRREGLEPSRPRGPGLLRPVCLPISPPARRSLFVSQRMHREDSTSRPRGPGHLGPLSANFSTCADQKIIGMTGFDLRPRAPRARALTSLSYIPLFVLAHLRVFDIVGRQDSSLGYAQMLFSPGSSGGVIPPARPGTWVRPRRCVPVARMPIYPPYLLVSAITRSASEAGALTRLGYIPKSAREELNLQPPHS